MTKVTHHTPRSWLTFFHCSQQFATYPNISRVHGQNGMKTRCNALKCVKTQAQNRVSTAKTLPTIYNGLKLFLTMVFNSLPPFATICNNLQQFVTVYHELDLLLTMVFHSLQHFATICNNSLKFVIV